MHKLIAAFTPHSNNRGKKTRPSQTHMHARTHISQTRTHQHTHAHTNTRGQSCTLVDWTLNIWYDTQTTHHTHQAPQQHDHFYVPCLSYQRSYRYERGIWVWMQRAKKGKKIPLRTWQISHQRVASCQLWKSTKIKHHWIGVEQRYMYVCIQVCVCLFVCVCVRALVLVCMCVCACYVYACL